jgi:Bardet-Biedl syndrome 4 protein
MGRIKREQSFPSDQRGTAVRAHSGQYGTACQCRFITQQFNKGEYIGQPIQKSGIMSLVSPSKFADLSGAGSTPAFNPQVETEKEKRNWLIHLLFIRHDYVECLKVIEQQLEACQGLCEYAIYVKGLILRQKGQIQDSLSLFQATVMLNPNNPSNLKQVGRSYYLLGRHRDAIECYEEAQKLSPEDWEIWYNKGLCFSSTKQFEEAEECFMRSNSIQRHDATYMELGKVYTAQEKYEAAIELYLEALE